MIFIDAWIVWLLAMTQPNVTNVPNASQPAVATSVTAIHPTRRATARANAFTPSAQSLVPPNVTGRSDLREATQISNGY